MFKNLSTPTVFIFQICPFVFIYQKKKKKNSDVVFCSVSLFVLNVKMLNENVSFRSFKSQLERNFLLQNVNTKPKLWLFLLCRMNKFDFARKFKFNPVINISNTNMLRFFKTHNSMQLEIFIAIFFSSLWAIFNKK